MTKSKDAKRRKAALLGMPVQTAERKLRKAVIHELAKQCGKNMCRWCGLEISDPDELALIHVDDWEESPDQYFDLGNVALSHASCAADRGGRRQGEESEMRVEISVEDAHGNRLPGARHDNELYVAGKKNARYQVRVRNRTRQRVLAVVTVDGRNVNTGEPGDHTGPGHVLEPHQSWVFTGWRTSDDEVAAFRLGSKGDAYSSQMGSKENVGVIGVAVFEELEPEPKIVTVRETRFVPMPYVVPVEPWPPRPWRPWPWREPHITWTTADLNRSTTTGIASVSCSTGDAAPASGSSFQIDPDVQFSTTVSQDSAPVASVQSRGGAKASRPRVRRRKKEGARQELGTEFGEQLHSSVVSCSFVRDTDEPCEVHVIRYDSTEALKRRGISVARPSKRQDTAPEPFPQNHDGYCAPPSRRRAYKG